jgi:hypothetical protein
MRVPWPYDDVVRWEEEKREIAKLERRREELIGQYDKGTETQKQVGGGLAWKGEDLGQCYVQGHVVYVCMVVIFRSLSSPCRHSPHWLCLPPSPPLQVWQQYIGRRQATLNTAAKLFSSRAAVADVKHAHREVCG